MRLSIVKICVLLAIKLIYLGHGKCEYHGTNVTGNEQPANSSSTGSLTNDPSFNETMNSITVEETSTVIARITPTSATTGSESTATPTGTDQSTSTGTSSYFETIFTTTTRASPENDQSTNNLSTGTIAYGPSFSETGNANALDETSTITARITPIPATTGSESTASQVDTVQNATTTRNKSTNLITGLIGQGRNSTITPSRSSTTTRSGNGRGSTFHSASNEQKSTEIAVNNASQFSKTGSTSPPTGTWQNISTIAASIPAVVKSRKHTSFPLSSVTFGQHLSTTVARSYSTVATTTKKHSFPSFSETGNANALDETSTITARITPIPATTGSESTASQVDTVQNATTTRNKSTNLITGLIGQGRNSTITPSRSSTTTRSGNGRGSTFHSASNEQKSTEIAVNNASQFSKTGSTSPPTGTWQNISTIAASIPAVVKSSKHTSFPLSSVTFGQHLSTTVARSYSTVATTTKKPTGRTTKHATTSQSQSANLSISKRSISSATVVFSATSTTMINNGTSKLQASPSESQDVSVKSLPSNSVVYSGGMNSSDSEAHFNSSEFSSSSTTREKTSHVSSGTTKSVGTQMETSETNATTPLTMTPLLEMSTTHNQVQYTSPNASPVKTSPSPSASKFTTKVGTTEVPTEALTTTQKVCNNGDYSLNLNISDIQYNKVTFEWDRPICTGKAELVTSYELKIHAPQETYRFTYPSNRTSATISSGPDTAQTDVKAVLIPCERYYGHLVAKLANGVIAEAWQNFTIPLNINNPLDSSGKFRQETGQGWVSLSWNMGKACGSNNDNGLVGNHQSLSSLKVEISGSRGMAEPKVLNLSMECADWNTNQSRVQFNLTNSNKKCSYEWKWAPCSNYTLKLTPMLHDRTTNRTTNSTSTILNVRTTIENNKTDAKVESLNLVNKGSNWLFLRWKRPSCLPEASTLYKVVLAKYPDNLSVCPQNLTANDIQQENCEYYDSYNLTTCDQPLKPCSNYTIRVRGEYEGLNTSFKRSDDLKVETELPPLPKLEVETITHNLLRLAWFEVEECTNYPLQKFNLTIIKDGVRAESQVQEVDKTNCNKTSVLGDKQKCGTDIQVSPCTSYRFELLPIFKNYINNVTPMSVSHDVEFPDIGENYNMTSGESGSNWAMLNLRLNPHCLRYVQNLSFTLIDEDSPTPRQTTFHTDYLNKTKDGIVLLNLTSSPYFLGFYGFQSCTGRYTVKVRPMLQKYKSKSELSTGIQLKRRIPSISYARITDRGSNWIFLVWAVPHCETNLLPVESYLVTLGDATKNCSMSTTSFFTYMNVSSPVNCSNGEDVLVVKPCTEYHFQVQPKLRDPLLTAKTNFTLSNHVYTLPDPSKLYIQNFTIFPNLSDSDSMRLIFQWDPPICSHYIKDYQLDFQDNFGENFSAIVSPSCLKNNNELSWPPARSMQNCQISTTREGISLQLEPCTNYTIAFRPRVNEVNEDRIPKYPQIKFRTRSAKPGKVTSLRVKEATDEKLVIEWGNVTENSRCLERYEVTLREDNQTTVTSVLVSNQLYEFDKLKPCNTYSINLKSKGVDTDGESAEISAAMGEPDEKTPRKVEFSYVGSTSVNLTWEKLPHHSKCHYLYSVEVYTILPTGERKSSDKRKTMDTHMYFAGLQPETLYEFCFVLHTASRQYQECYSTETQPADTDYIAFAFYVLVTIICTTVLASFVGWCCVKRPYKVCHSLANKKLKKTVHENGNSAQHNHMASNYRMRNIATNRPIRIDDFDDVLNEFMEESSTSLEEEYKDLKSLSKEDQPKLYATKPENKVKNRYVNILPYDHSRVQLSPVEEDENGDYINASFIQGFNGAREYIAAQGPKPNTVDDYWRMIWEQDVNMLVMLTLIEEKDKIKCAQYWPDLGQTICYGSIKVTQVLQVNMDNYVIRDLDIECNEEKRSIKQMHFLTWPDFGCPDNPETLVSFVEAVRDRVPPMSTKQPILVHCSAGVGRTGTFIVVDWLMQEARVSDRVDVFNTVLKIRYDRVNMVQTEDQYFFIHQCLSHFFKTRPRPKSPSISVGGSKTHELPKSNHTLKSSRGTLHESQVNLTAITVESD